MEVFESSSKVNYYKGEDNPEGNWPIKKQLTTKKKRRQTKKRK